MELRGDIGGVISVELRGGIGGLGGWSLGVISCFLCSCLQTGAAPHLEILRSKTGLPCSGRWEGEEEEDEGSLFEICKGGRQRPAVSKVARFLLGV